MSGDDSEGRRVVRERRLGVELPEVIGVVEDVIWSQTFVYKSLL